jgi:hypothetical protein
LASLSLTIRSSWPSPSASPKAADHANPNSTGSDGKSDKPPNPNKPIRTLVAAVANVLDTATR